MSFKPDGTPRLEPRHPRRPTHPRIARDRIRRHDLCHWRERQPGITAAESPWIRADSALHVFNSTGGYFGQTAFPEHDGGGGTTASPNIWRFNGTELVIVPAVYGSRSSACSLSHAGGGLVLDQHATTIPHGDLRRAVVPGGTVFRLPTGKIPRSEDGTATAVSGRRHLHQSARRDALHSAVRSDPRSWSASCCPAAPSSNCSALHDDNRFMRSAPAILARPACDHRHGGRRAGPGILGPTAASGGAAFSGPNMNKLAPVTGLQGDLRHADAPGRRADSIDREGADGRARRPQRRQEDTLDRRSRPASAAASRTHLFVSTSDAIQTFDPVSLTGSVAHAVERRRPVAAGRSVRWVTSMPSPATPCTCSRRAEAAAAQPRDAADRRRRW